MVRAALAVAQGASFDHHALGAGVAAAEEQEHPASGALPRLHFIRCIASRCGSHCAEEQEYRDRVRKQKQLIYDQYLWRKLLMADFQAHSAFMMSPAWEATHAARIARCLNRLLFIFD